jgi:hypothetical protein
MLMRKLASNPDIVACCGRPWYQPGYVDVYEHGPGQRIESHGPDVYLPVCICIQSDLGCSVSASNGLVDRRREIVRNS